MPLAGIEPALLAELDFESSASTNSATGATQSGRYHAPSGGVNDPRQPVLPSGLALPGSLWSKGRPERTRPLCSDRSTTGPCRSPLGTLRARRRLVLGELVLSRAAGLDADAHASGAAGVAAAGITALVGGFVAFRYLF